MQMCVRACVSDNFVSQSVARTIVSDGDGGMIAREKVIITREAICDVIITAYHGQQQPTSTHRAANADSMQDSK